MVSPYVFLKLATFFIYIIAVWKMKTFLDVISSPLPSSHIVYTVFFSKSCHKKINSIRVSSPLDGVTRGGPPAPPSETTVWAMLSEIKLTTPMMPVWRLWYCR